MWTVTAVRPPNEVCGRLVDRESARVSSLLLPLATPTNTEQDRSGFYWTQAPSDLTAQKRGEEEGVFNQFI